MDDLAFRVAPGRESEFCLIKLEARLPTISDDVAIKPLCQVKRYSLQKTRSVDETSYSNRAYSSRRQSLWQSNSENHHHCVRSSLEKLNGRSKMQQMSMTADTNKGAHAVAATAAAVANDISVVHNTNSLKSEHQQPTDSGVVVGGAKTTTTSSPNYEFSTKIIKPNDYFFFSIFTSLFCCLPIGLFALYFSVKSARSYHLYSFSRSIRFSKMSLKINLAALLVGFIVSIICFTMFFIILTKAIEEI